MIGLKILVLLTFIATLVTLAVTDGELKTTKQISSGINEFKGVLMGLEKVVTTEKLLGSIKQLSGFLGVVGGIISFALAFIPEQESAELKFMKKEFAQVNMKLDSITKDIDNVKNLITLEAQRAQYVDSASKIMFAYKQLTTTFLDEVTANSSCSTERDCLKERLAISERFVEIFNIKADVYKLLKGTVNQMSVFGEPLLELVQTTYKCDIDKVLNFANGVIKLAFKGQYVVLAYEKLTGTNVSISYAMEEWSEMVYKVRQKADEIRLDCYKNIHKYMEADITDMKYQTGFQDNKNAAVAMRNDLRKKYPWVSWTVLSYGAYGGQYHWGWQSFINMPSKGRERVLRVVVSDPGTYSTQRQKFATWLENFSNQNRSIYFYDAHRLYDLLKSNMTKDGIYKTLSSLVVMMTYDDHQVDSDRSDLYFDQEMNIAFRLESENKYKKIRIWASFKSDQQMSGVICSKSCSDKGSCKLIPYTSKSYCLCSDYFYGAECENYDKTSLAANVDTMIAVTSRIPKVSDVYFELEHLQDYIGVSLGETEKSITSLDVLMQAKFDELNYKLTTEFQWQDLVTKYSESMDSLSFCLHKFQSMNSSDPTYEMENEQLAKEVVGPFAIEKWVYDLNYLMIGRTGILLDHKPLILLIIDQLKNKACSEKYKEALDTAWRQLVILQNQAYIMWAKSLAILHQSSAHVTSMYQQQVSRQTTLMKDATCQITILNSVNVNCSGGFYMYPEIELTNQCNDNSYISGNTSVTCSKPSSCYACDCNQEGSTSNECDDQTGKCSCKNNFYGTQCNIADCVWSSWTSTSSCGLPCRGNYIGTMTRIRYKITTSHDIMGKDCSGESTDKIGCSLSNSTICYEPLIIG